MGIFDRFPYSSTHEMNLDFMLGKATEIAEDMQTVTAGMAQVQAGLSAISEKTEQATQAAAQAAASASSIEGSVTAAEEAAEEAQMHNESAQTWANNAMTYKADCQRSATEAAASSASAAQAATAAAASEDTVAQYAQAANASAQSAANNNDSAHQYANQASASASNATFHSSNAQTAATNAQTAATNANTSATNASASADRAASLKTDVETLHRTCVAAVDQAATEAVNAANSAAQAAATKTDVETLVESLPEDFTDLNNTVNQLSDEIVSIKSTVGATESAPAIYEDLTKYANELTNLSSVSDVSVPQGATIKNVKIYSVGKTNVTCLVFIIRKSDNVCVFLKTVRNFDAGWNTVDIDYYCSTECYIGQYNTGVKYTNSGVTEDYKFSNKVRRTNPTVPTVGQAVTITEQYSGNFALSMYWETETGMLANIATVSSVANEALAKATDPHLYDHPCLISFIDDDTGVYVPQIWGAILSQSSIRMGFACITGYISGEETGTGVYAPMSKADLDSLYSGGHEVYSHSFSHPAFYADSTTLEMLNEQCYKSRDWLFKNGYCRGADIIVYPGGLGEGKTEKQAIIRQYYKYGVDTVGGGINPEPLNPVCIYRTNADTGTLEELKAIVDDAVAQGKLLIFMNHAYELHRDETNQIEKMVALIDYIKTTTAEILPLGEALHRIYGWDYHFNP